MAFMAKVSFSGFSYTRGIKHNIMLRRCTSKNLKRTSGPKNFQPHISICIYIKDKSCENGGGSQNIYYVGQVPEVVFINGISALEGGGIK